MLHQIAVWHDDKGWRQVLGVVPNMSQPYVHTAIPIMPPKRAQVAPQLQPPYQELTVKRPLAVRGLENERVPKS